MSGCYVYKDDAIHKVPATPAEAVASSLMGFMQKHRFKSFLQVPAPLHCLVHPF